MEKNKCVSQDSPRVLGSFNRVIYHMHLPAQQEYWRVVLRENMNLKCVLILPWFYFTSLNYNILSSVTRGGEQCFTHMDVPELDCVIGAGSHQ